MNFNDSKLVDITELSKPQDADYHNIFVEAVKQAIKPYLHYIKLLQDQVELRDRAIAELEARAKRKKYQCSSPSCGWYFDELRISHGGFKLCPMCGALNYRKLEYKDE